MASELAEKSCGEDMGITPFRIDCAGLHGRVEVVLREGEHVPYPTCVLY